MKPVSRRRVLQRTWLAVKPPPKARLERSIVNPRQRETRARRNQLLRGAHCMTIGGARSARVMSCAATWWSEKWGREDRGKRGGGRDVVKSWSK